MTSAVTKIRISPLLRMLFVFFIENLLSFE